MTKEREELNRLKTIERTIGPVIPHGFTIFFIEIVLILMVSTTQPVTKIVHENANDCEPSEHIALRLGKNIVASKNCHQ